MSLAKIETLGIIGGAIVLVGALYYVARKAGAVVGAAATAASAAAQTAGASVASAAEYFAPLVNPSSLVTYFIVFPNGATHAVNGDEIDAAGFFYYNGARYQVGDASGRRVARAA